MKILLSIIVFALVIAGVLALAGCGGTVGKTRHEKMRSTCGCVTACTCQKDSCNCTLFNQKCVEGCTCVKPRGPMAKE